MHHGYKATNHNHRNNPSDYLFPVSTFGKGLTIALFLIQVLTTETANLSQKEDLPHSRFTYKPWVVYC